MSEVRKQPREKLAKGQHADNMVSSHGTAEGTQPMSGDELLKFQQQFEIEYALKHEPVQATLKNLALDMTDVKSYLESKFMIEVATVVKTEIKKMGKKQKRNLKSLEDRQNAQLKTSLKSLEDRQNAQLKTSLKSLEDRQNAKFKAISTAVNDTNTLLIRLLANQENNQ